MERVETSKHSFILIGAELAVTYIIVLNKMEGGEKNVYNLDLDNLDEMFEMLKKVGLVLAMLLAIFILMIACCCYCCCGKSKKKKEK